MKMWLNKRIAMLMTFVLIVPLLWNMNVAVASAATPAFVQTNVEIVGVGETYQLQIKDKVDNSKYTWTSSNNNVATVSTKGLVASVAKGSTTIKCKITYPSKKTKTLSCKVVVSIPSEEVKINNATLENGAHLMTLGQSMDFNCDLVPANTSDKVFWSVGGGDAGCIRIDDEKTGKVTAVKAGKTILVATAAKSATKDAAALSIVNDAVIIEVVGPTATVKSADITGANEIKVVFDSPVQQNTVIGANGVLSDNIELTMSKDTKGVLASDPGKLTASLSSDLKTLTIKTEKAMSGYYGINFTSNILTTDGVAIESYYKKITYNDITPPSFVGTVVDDNGYVVTINFSEPINFTNLKTSGAALISTTGETANPATISTLNNVMNYTISDDKKSMTINLSKISSTDYGKLFSVIISGITDMAGNAPANAYITVYLRTDTSPKPQAKLLYVRRTSYDTLTATFDRAILTGGYAQIAGGPTMTGVVDTTDSKKVNYTMSPAEALYTGVKVVSVGHWNSYNVIATDNTANTMYNYNVDFTADVTSPVMIASNYDTSKGVLTLTYNEPVTLTAATGIFVSTYTSAIEDIVPNTNITYTKITHTDGDNIIKLQLTGMSLIGTYSFNIEQGFVTDNYRNKSVVKSMSLNNASGNSAELPAPYDIRQSTDNLSQITLKFINKLDKPSAETISNYKIPGVSIIKAELTVNSSTGAVVVLTVADSSIQAEISYPFTISGIKGYNNSYSAITSYPTTIDLKENVRPTYNAVTGPVFDKVGKNNIQLSFSEPVKGTMTVKVYQQIGSTYLEIPATVTVTGSSAYINLTTTVPSSTWLRIDVSSNTITDMNGNAIQSLPSTLMCLASY